MALPGVLGAIGTIGTAAAGVGSLVSAFGGSRNRGSSSGSTGSPEIDFYEQYGAQAAAANNPLTAAMQALSVLQGSLGGALGQEGTTLSSSQLTVLAEAANQAKAQTNTQASEVARLFGAGVELQKLLGNARIQTELLGPTFQAQAAQAAYQGENDLAKGLASTNLNIKSLQESARLQAGLDQAQTLGNVFETRAANEGKLALGAQALQSGLQLQQAKTLSDLAKIQGQTKAQLAMKRFGAGMALAGTRAFA